MHKTLPSKLVDRGPSSIIHKNSGGSLISVYTDSLHQLHPSHADSVCLLTTPLRTIRLCTWRYGMPGYWARVCRLRSGPGHSRLGPPAATTEANSFSRFPSLAGSEFFSTDLFTGALQ